MLSREWLDAWMTAYGSAWSSNDAQDVATLFTEDASYSVGPFAQPWLGRDLIVEQWTSDPLGQRDVVFEHDVLAVDADTGVVRWRADYTAASDGRRYRLAGVLVARFAANGPEQGRCFSHEEWFDRRELGQMDAGGVAATS